MISIEINEKPDSNWNKRLLESPMGTVHNTKSYVTSINRTVGLEIKPLFIKFLNNKGEIVGQVALAKFLLYQENKLRSKILKRLPGRKKMIYRWNYGPVIFDSDFQYEIANELKKFLMLQKCRVSGTENPLNGGHLTIMKNPFIITNWGTFLLDLSQGQENLWKKMDKHSTRKNIERTEKRGVYVKQINRSDLELYRQLRIEKDFQLGYGETLALDTVERTWDILQEIGWTGFIAFQDEKPISGIMITYFNGFINEWGIARIDQNIVPKVYPQDLLKWEIIKWACKKKFRYYDLTGINPNPANEKERGILRYKKKWGGKLFEYNLIKF